MERMTKIDENIQTAQNLLSGIIERCYELEEGNKKLKKENENLKEKLFNIKRNTKYNRLQDKLVFDDSKTAIEQGARAYEAELHNRYVSELEEENKKLREDLAECYDLREELDYRKREAKRLGWTPEKAKKQYKFMEEDTLQELRDLGEI